MSVFVLGYGFSGDWQAALKQACYRKATKGMILCDQALTDCLAPFSELSLDDEVAIVLGSGEGEMDVTNRFLKGLGESGVARPLLFQNSLHNSTLGFLTQTYQALGAAAITVSNGCVSGEDSLSLVKDLLECGQVSFALAVAFDVLVEELEAVRDLNYPADVKRGESAACMLLCNERALQGRSLVPRAELCSIKFAKGALPVERTYYDADGLECFARALDNERDDGVCLVSKPADFHSVIEFRRL